MAAEARHDEQLAEPDYVMVANAALHDGGPRYTETPPDPYGPGAPPIAEPWNAATATLFVAIAVAWLVRLWGRYREYPFLTACLPILLVGGVGGTLYHAFRSERLYLLLDVAPIQVLGVAGAVFLALRLWGRHGWLYLGGAVAVYLGMSRLLFAVVMPRNRQVAISLNYASLATMILVPMILLVVRTRFRHAKWVLAGLVSFAIAFFFRVADDRIGHYMTMGSHWVWHTFGALATGLVIEYFYLVETDRHRAQAAAVVDGPSAR